MNDVLVGCVLTLLTVLKLLTLLRVLKLLTLLTVRTLLNVSRLDLVGSLDHPVFDCVSGMMCWLRLSIVTRVKIVTIV